MKPVEQTRFGNAGDCFSACVASLLELPLRCVPAFDNDKGADGKWFERWQQWLALRGWQFISCAASPEQMLTRGYAIISCDSPRSQIGDELPGDTNFTHAVVVRDGDVVFDPHPDRDAGPLGNWRTWYILVPLDPAKKCTWPDGLTDPMVVVKVEEKQTLPLELVVQYEIAGRWWTSLVPFNWLQEWLAAYMVALTSRKLARFHRWAAPLREYIQRTISAATEKEEARTNE